MPRPTAKELSTIPNMTASVELPSLQLQQTAITGIKAQLNVAAHRASLVLVSEVAQAHVEARGTVNLTPGYDADLTVDLSRTPLRPLLALYFPGLPEGFAGETELHATLHGPLGRQVADRGAHHDPHFQRPLSKSPNCERSADPCRFYPFDAHLAAGRDSWNRHFARFGGSRAPRGSGAALESHRQGFSRCSHRSDPSA